MTDRNFAFFNRILEREALSELDSFRSLKEAEGKIEWDSWPYGDKALTVLIRASWSHQCGCKGGLINEHGRPGKFLNIFLLLLRSRGYLDEFVPTKLGWLALEKFAPEAACFPKNYERQLREQPPTSLTNGQGSEAEGSSIV